MFYWKKQIHLSVLPLQPNQLPPVKPSTYKWNIKPIIAKKETIENNFTKLLALNLIEK